MFAALLLAAMAPATISCNSDNNSTSLNRVDAFAGCTPLYVGNSTALEEVTKDLILYYVDDEDVFWIPYFFKDTQGQIEFKWNRETNKIEMRETVTGMYNEGYPVYVLSQKQYNNMLGSEAKESYYDPATKSFTFCVLLQMSTETGVLFTKDTILKFDITSEYKK